MSGGGSLHLLGKYNSTSAWKPTEMHPTRLAVVQKLGPPALAHHVLQQMQNLHGHGVLTSVRVPNVVPHGGRPVGDESEGVYTLKHVLLPVHIAELYSIRVHAYGQLYKTPVGPPAHVQYARLQVRAL